MIWLIVTARRAFVCFSSASGSCRSLKTFPELGVTEVLFLFCETCFIVFLCYPQPFSDQIDIRLCCLRTTPRFFLEGVKYVYRAFKAHRVNCPKSIGAMIFYNL